MKSFLAADSRGLTRFDWLTSYHSFSFGNYFNGSKMNFGALQVINDDYINPRGGFPTHPHKNMEIITIVLEGELSHADSTGTEEIIRYGEIQKMSAGRGIYHSEFNDSTSERIHLLQIWIVPDKMNLEPSYDKIIFSPEQIANNLFKIAGGSPGSPVHINQDAELYLSQFGEGMEFLLNVAPGRMVYLHVIDGKINIEGTHLSAGDAYAVDEPGLIKLDFKEKSRFVLFDLIKA